MPGLCFLTKPSWRPASAPSSPGAGPRSLPSRLVAPSLASPRVAAAHLLSMTKLLSSGPLGSCQSRVPRQLATGPLAGPCSWRAIVCRSLSASATLPTGLRHCRWRTSSCRVALGAPHGVYACHILRILSNHFAITARDQKGQEKFFINLESTSHQVSVKGSLSIYILKIQNHNQSGGHSLFFFNRGHP